MKAILLIDVPDEVWKNKEKDLGMYVELWSERIDKDWFGKYYSDSLKPIPQRKYYSDGEDIRYIDGYVDCLEEILGEEQ